MKRLLTLLGLVCLCLNVWSQNPAWPLPGRYINYISNNSFSIPNLPVPSSLCNSGSGNNLPNNVIDGYDGQPARYTSNMIRNSEGEVEFFIVDGQLYDGEGNYINTLAINGGPVATGTSETVIVPDPANCDRYYIIASRTVPGLYIKEPYVFLLDMSLPNEMACADCEHYGALILQNCPGNQIMDYALPIACIANGFIPHDIQDGKYSNSHIAASKIQNGSFYWVFISNRDGIFRFRVDGNGFNFDNSIIPFGDVKDNPYNLRSEMELVEIDGGGFRLATIYSPDDPFANSQNIWEYLFVVELDANADPVVAPPIRFPMYAYTPGGNNLSPAIKGVEFSQNGERIYVTHSTSPAQPNQMEYYDFGTIPVQLQSFQVPTSIDVQFSMLELTGNDKLIAANQDGLWQVPNAANANVGTISQLWNMNYAPNWEGFTSGHFYKLYMLPDQIDGEDYSAHFGATTTCCINNSTFEAESYTAQTGTWQPNIVQNGGLNPLQPNVSSEIYVKEELRIPAGEELTIMNMVLHFAPGARIVIENGTNGQTGGRLTLLNTTLTVDDRCTEDEMWLGVEVWGNQNELQGTLSNSTQGKLVLSSNSRIEHAWIGVLVGKRRETLIDLDPCPPEVIVQPFSFDYTRAGGIVQTSRSTFLGNQRGVYYLPYFSTNGADNLGRFTLTDFIWDGTLRGNVSPQNHALLHQVKGIRFRGCDFRNDTPSAFLYTQLGTGIFSYRAQFHVQTQCPVLVGVCDPCPGEVRSSFENLRFGVRTYNLNNESLTFSVKNSDFENCQYGTYVSSTKHEVLTGNNFEIRQANYQTAGIVLNYSTDFTVEENQLQGIGVPNGSNSYGIVVNNSGTDQNEIYLNQFKDLKIGGQSERINATEITTSNYPGVTGFTMSGLNWICNSFNTELEEADLTVVDGRIDYFQGHAIGHNSVNEAVLGSARNKFSQDGEALALEHDLKVSGNNCQPFQYVGLNAAYYWADSYTQNCVLPLIGNYFGPVAPTPGMCPTKCGVNLAGLRSALSAEIVILEDQLARSRTVAEQLELETIIRQKQEHLAGVEKRMITAALLDFDALTDLNVELLDLGAEEIYESVERDLSSNETGEAPEPVLGEPAAFLPLISSQPSRKQTNPEIGAQLELLVYPNPGNGDFKLKLPGIETGTVAVKVIDNMGRLVHQETVEVESEISLELQELPAGFYQLIVLNGKSHLGSTLVEIRR